MCFKSKGIITFFWSPCHLQLLRHKQPPWSTLISNVKRRRKRPQPWKEGRSTVPILSRSWKRTSSKKTYDTSHHCHITHNLSGLTFFFWGNWPFCFVKKPLQQMGDSIVSLFPQEVQCNLKVVGRWAVQMPIIVTIQRALMLFCMHSMNTRLKSIWATVEDIVLGWGYPKQVIRAILTDLDVTISIYERIELGAS